MKTRAQSAASGADASTAHPRHERFEVLALDDPSLLSQWAASWEDLAAHAAEPNPFYEPWMLLPALEWLSKAKRLVFVLVTAKARIRGERDTLVGFFPFERANRYRQLPLKHLTLWKHEYCFLCTPLIRKGAEHAVWTAVFDWLAVAPEGPALFELPLLTTDGLLFQTLITVLGERAWPFLVSKCETRALLRPRADADAYLAETLPTRSRKEYRRLERRLAELGPLEYIEPGPAEMATWCESFLALEAQGWKGRGGTALASTDNARQFFSAVIKGGGDRLMLLGLHADGRPVALKCNLLSGEGSFAFKIAFDESQKRFSPGVLLELENIRRFHTRTGLCWMDSCATPEHFMANRLWLDRRTLSTLVVAAGSVRGDLIVSSLPLLRSMVHATRKALTRIDDATPPSGDTPHEGWLDLDPQTFRTSFGRTPFAVRHSLADSALFQLPRLLELSRRLPKSSVEYNAGDVPRTLDPSETPRTGLSVEETLESIETCRSWMVLKNVERDPAYAELLSACLGEIGRLSHAVGAGMSDKESFIFISSPGSVTPFHMDPEENFLLQVRGHKTIHVFDPLDRSILSDTQIERFFTGNDRNLVFRDEYQGKARVFPLGPGQGVHVPVTSPHWVQNGEEVSISFSITFQTKSSRRWTHAHRMNADLRRWGLAPRAVTGSTRDAAKQFAYRATHWSARR